MLKSTFGIFFLSTQYPWDFSGEYSEQYYINIHVTKAGLFVHLHADIETWKNIVKVHLEKIKKSVINLWLVSS